MGTYIKDLEEGERLFHDVMRTRNTDERLIIEQERRKTVKAGSPQSASTRVTGMRRSGELVREPTQTRQLME